MWQNPYEDYLDNKVLSADPLELVSLLYEACRAAIKDARRHLESGQIGERSRAITKALNILTELATALDHDRGGEISQSLGQLYDYMQRRLLEANHQQTDEPMAEVLNLLSTLEEAWKGLKQESQPVVSEAPASTPWTQAEPDVLSGLKTEYRSAAEIPSSNPWAQPEAEVAYASGGWSL